MNEKQARFFQLVSMYPSPHNGQPMVLKKINETTYDLYFQTARGLTATPISYLFSFTTIGVFVEYIEACGRALGHVVTVNVKLPTVEAMAQSDSDLLCGRMTIAWSATAADERLVAAIEFRQTSRKKYSRGLLPQEKTQLATLMSEGQRLIFLTNREATQTIWLNQRAVFDDMFDNEVRSELAHWLRTSHKEKIAKKDGLSYDCMELSGTMLRLVLQHYKVLHWPIIAPLLKRYYMRTMKDSSTVGYLLSTFETEHQSFEIGKTITRMWLELSRHHKYLHPFGTIVSNNQAHNDFVQLVGLEDESRDKDYVVFIFRAGTSEVPVRSERLGIMHMVE